MLITMNIKHIYVMLYKHKYFKLKEYVVINIYIYVSSTFSNASTFFETK